MAAEDEEKNEDGDMDMNIPSVDVMTCSRFVCFRNIIQASPILVHDICFLAHLIPNFCFKDSFMLECGIEPLSEAVTFSFAMLSTAFLMQDPKSAICNMFSTNAYHVLMKAAKDVLKTKQMT